MPENGSRTTGHTASARRLTMPQAINTTIVILAGGEGQRMGGDKPLRPWRGARLVGRAVEIARGDGGEIAISVRAVAQLPDPPAPLIYDSSDIAGPLAGLESALRFAAQRGAARVLTIPCDAPLLPADLLANLDAALIGGRRCALAQAHGQLHPDCALWEADLASSLRAFHGSGRASLRGFATYAGMAIADWGAPEPNPFANANTPEELAGLEAAAPR